MALPDPNYDLQSALETLAPGYIIQRELLDAAAAQYEANGFTPLTAVQAQALCLAAARGIEAAEGLSGPPLPPQPPVSLPNLGGI